MEQEPENENETDSSPAALYHLLPQFLTQMETAIHSMSEMLKGHSKLLVEILDKMADHKQTTTLLSKETQTDIPSVATISTENAELKEDSQQGLGADWAQVSRKSDVDITHGISMMTPLSDVKTSKLYSDFVKEHCKIPLLTHPPLPVTKVSIFSKQKAALHPGRNVSQPWLT
ncbi:hypothetical protein BaRGS_00020242 [Batillaria attramentaria]|uniref:Uncharacterized protein n=1 Tax=Batillaria attramentaria TaxID=370345 RepID=A0ABD0KNF9_9CAEN